MSLAVAMLLCACSPKAPKYESILDEVLSCMVPESNDDIHLVQEDERQLIKTFRYHSGFGKIPNVKDLWLYLSLLDKSVVFNTPDGVEAFRLEKDIYGPAVDSLCAFVEYGGNYPSVPVLAAIHHLQEQYARAMDIDPQIGIGAAIWLNRFTEQAVKYCPDIRLVAKRYDGVGGNYVGIIEMPKGELKPLTNIIVTDFDGERQISFGVNMLVNKVKATYMNNNPHFLLYRDDAPEVFEAFVLTPGENGNPEILTGTNRKENRQATSAWIEPVLRQGNLRLYPLRNCSLDLIVDRDGHQESRTLRYVESEDSCRFVFDLQTDVSHEIVPDFREMLSDLDGDTDSLLDSLSNPFSSKWNKLFSIREDFIKQYLPGEYSHSGTLLAIVDDEDNVAIADYSRRSILPSRMDGNGSTVISIRFSPDDSEVLVQSWSGRTALFDVRTGNLLKEASTQESEMDTRIAYDWNKNEGYVGNGNKLLRLKLNEGLSELVDTLDSPINDILPHINGHLLINTDKGLVLYNPEEKTETERIPFGYEGYRTVALSPNNRFVLTYDGEGIVQLWDIESPDNNWTMNYLEGYSNSIGFSNDGTKFIFIDGANKSVSERTIYTNV